MEQQKPIAILGAGSWGTALALYLARRGQLVRIWSIDPTEIAEMQTNKESRYLPSIKLPNGIQPTDQLAEAIHEVQDILVVVPSIGFRDTLIAIKHLLNSKTRLICATKGLDAGTGQLFSQVAAEVIGTYHPFAVLSGPSFAREVAAGLPAAVSLASQDNDFLSCLIKRFDSPIFNIYPTHDVIGVEVGGVAKNVIAIATGITDGMGLGANTRSALITLGLAEIIRLGQALGGQLETFIGLSGMGDLILTCSDDQSRNRRLGLSLGKGKNIQAAEKEIGQVVEGKRNAELVSLLAKQKQISMPICEMVWQILQGQLEANNITSLLRP